MFEKYFDYQQAGSGGETHAVINYREDESMWVEQFLFTFFLWQLHPNNLQFNSNRHLQSFLTWNYIVRLITVD